MRSQQDAFFRVSVNNGRGTGCAEGHSAPCPTLQHLQQSNVTFSLKAQGPAAISGQTKPMTAPVTYSVPALQQGPTGLMPHMMHELLVSIFGLKKRGSPRKGQRGAAFTSCTGPCPGVSLCSLEPMGCLPAFRCPHHILTGPCLLSEPPPILAGYMDGGLASQ